MSIFLTGVGGQCLTVDSLREERTKVLLKMWWGRKSKSLAKSVVIFSTLNLLKHSCFGWYLFLFYFFTFLTKAEFWFITIYLIKNTVKLQ